ncbi:MAG: class I SAM-dependent methyltransferase [Acidimicrobiia bacterium]
MEIFHEQPSVPAHSVLLMSSRADAVNYPRGEIRLGFCRACGFISNLAFDASLNEYSQQCEESQGFSPYFRSWLRGVAEDFVARYRLYGKSVLEIGCGKGEFLALVCELGGNRGVGIDPAYVPGRFETDSADGIRFINELYSEAHGDLAGDAVVCRHTLEHIGPVADFVGIVRRSLGGRDDVVVFFELPETLRVLREVAFWDVYYEHCSYFSAGSLARLFRATGFDVLAVAPAFDDQYLLIEARPAALGTSQPAPSATDLEAVRAGAAQFADGYRNRIAGWQATVADVTDRHRRTVVWGSGSKGVAFLNALGGSAIEFAVDVNPHKHGMYMAGTGQRIVPPMFLQQYRPDLIIVMNPTYLGEIKRNLDDLRVEAELVAV